MKYGAMLSGDIMGNSGESKGVVLWLLVRLLQNATAWIKIHHLETSKDFAHLLFGISSSFRMQQERPRLE